MQTNGGRARRCVVGFVLGLLLLVAGCGTPGLSGSSSLSGIDGAWSWRQGSSCGELTFQKDGNTYTGTLDDLSEGTYGDKIVGVTLKGGRIKFTRAGRFGIQEWEGTLKEENGVLRIVDGRWTKESALAERLGLPKPSGSFTAEKIAAALRSEVEGGPVNLGPNVNTADNEGSVEIAADGLTLYFDAMNRPGGPGGWDLWMSQAQTPHHDFGPAAPVPAPVNSRYDESGPSISADGLELYFASNRPGGNGGFDIWVAKRKTVNDPWGEPNNLGGKVNSPSADNHPSISADGLSLYFDWFRSSTSGLYHLTDLYVTRRATRNDPWGEPEPVTPLNTPGYEYSPDLSTDGLTLYYDSPSAGRDLWVAKRAAPDAAWDKGVLLGSPFNTPGIDTDPSISADGSLLYFVSNRRGGQGGYDIWQMKTEKEQK